MGRDRPRRRRRRERGCCRCRGRGSRRCRRRPVRSTIRARRASPAPRRARGGAGPSPAPSSSWSAARRCPHRRAVRTRPTGPPAGFATTRRRPRGDARPGAAVPAGRRRGRAARPACTVRLDVEPALDRTRPRLDERRPLCRSDGGGVVPLELDPAGRERRPPAVVGRLERRRSASWCSTTASIGTPEHRDRCRSGARASPTG